MLNFVRAAPTPVYPSGEVPNGTTTSTVRRIPIPTTASTKEKVLLANNGVEE
jgi:hypothetical protein